MLLRKTLFFTTFPSDNPVACGLTALACAFRGFGNQTDPQKFFTQLAFGDLVIKFVF